MTAEEFRSNKDLVSALRTVLEMDVVQLAMEVLAGKAPVNHMPTGDVSPHFAHIQLGEQCGWAKYPIELLQLATHPPIPKDANPETDYAEQTE